MTSILNNYINKVVPLTIFIASIGNLLLKANGIPYVYVLAILLGIILIILRGICLETKDVYLLVIIGAYICYSLLYAILIPERGLQTLLGAGQYALFPLYWVLLFSCNSKFEFDDLLFKSIKFVVVIAICGLIQFYISADLFGIIPTAISENISWTTDAEFDAYKAFFRASSILSSPQVFGLFSALYLFFIESHVKNVLIRSILQLLVIVASLHSGDKISVVIFFAFLIYMIAKLLRAGHLLAVTLIIVSAVTIIGILVMYSDAIGFEIISRMNLYNIIDEEKEGRLSIWSNILNSYNFVWGEGPGFFFMVTDSGGKASESYFIQFLVENGTIFFLFFMAFMFQIISKIRTISVQAHRYLIILIMVSMVSAHTFGEPVFFIFWGLLVQTYRKWRPASVPTIIAHSLDIQSGSPPGLSRSNNIEM
jgi:hypothetical protein